MTKEAEIHYGIGRDLINLLVSQLIALGVKADVAGTRTLPPDLIVNLAFQNGGVLSNPSGWRRVEAVNDTHGILDLGTSDGAINYVIKAFFYELVMWKIED